MLMNEVSIVLQTLLDVSACLSSNVSFSSVGEALHHAMTTVKQVRLSLTLDHLFM